MKLKAICCDVLYREMCAAAARSVNCVDLEFLPKGLHDLGAEKMQARLQETIDRVDPERYEGILLGYALCSNGTCEPKSDRLPMVIARAHDCISLFLGSRHRYMKYFEENPGVYFETSGWLERGKAESSGDILAEQTIQGQIGLNVEYEKLIEKYGEDNAKYIFETLHAHKTRYGKITYIEMGIEPDARFEEQARQLAGQKEWAFEKLRGDMSMIQRLVDGPWDEEDFLTIPPGRTMTPTHDERIVGLK